MSLTVSLLFLSCYCLKVAASGSALSLDDLRALCVERLLQHDSDNVQVLTACSKLYRGFSAEAYLKQLEKRPFNEISPAPSSSHLRNRLLDPAYVLHTYMGYLLMKDDVFQAVSLAAKVEKQNRLPFESQVKLYKQVFDYHLQEGTLFYHSQGDFIKRSHAIAYAPLAGKLGIEVLVNHLHRLVDEFPAKHFSLQERQYISLASHQTVLWILRVKYGPKHGLQEFSSRKYWSTMPILSPKKLEEWARNFLKQENPIPDTIDKIIGGHGAIHPDLGSLLARAKFEPIAIDEFASGKDAAVKEKIGMDEEQHREHQLIDVEEIESSKEEEARGDGNMEVDHDEGFAKEEYVWGESGDDKAVVLDGVGNVEPETRAYDVEPEVKAGYSRAETHEEKGGMKDQLDLFDVSRHDGQVGGSVEEYHASDNSLSIEQVGTDGESSAGKVEVVDDYDQQIAPSVGDGEVVEVDQQTPPGQFGNEYSDDEESSQVEQGYDAEESQPEEEEQHPSASDFMAMQEPPGSPDETENHKLLPAKRAVDEAFPSSVPNAPVDHLSSGSLVVPEPFSEVDPGYEGEVSQCPTDFEEIIRPEKKPRLESGYDAGESQGHTEDEDDEEMQTEEEKEEIQDQTQDLETAVSQRKITGSRLERSLNPTLSDMSAADERTTGFDDDLAESSEREDRDKRKGEVVPALQMMPITAKAEDSSASLLVRFASAVQREDETFRATLKQSPVSGEPANEFATDMSVADSASRSASIESKENDDFLRLESETTSHMVDHVPKPPLDTKESQSPHSQVDDQQAVEKDAAAATVAQTDSGSMPSVMVTGGDDGTHNKAGESEDQDNGEGKSKLESETLIVDHVSETTVNAQESGLPPSPPSNAQSVERDDKGPAEPINADEEDHEQRSDGAGDDGAEDISDRESWYTGAQESPKTPQRQSLASTGTQTGRNVDFSSPQSRTSDITAHSPSPEQRSRRASTPPVGLRSSGSKRSRIVWRKDEDSSDEDHMASIENRSGSRSPKRHKSDKLEVIDEELDIIAGDVNMDASKASVESLDKQNSVDKKDKGGTIEAPSTALVVGAGKPPLPPTRKSLARKEGEGEQDAEKSKEALSGEVEPITDARSSTRRSTRKKSGEEEEVVEEEPTMVRRSTPSRKAKSDQSVASATRSTRRSSRNKSTEEKEEEEAVEEEPTTVLRSTPSRKAKSAKDDKSVASATRSTRRSTRHKSTEEAEEEKPTTARRSTPPRKAKSAKDDQSVASATRSTRRSTRNKSTEEKEEEEEAVKEEPSMVRRSTPSRKAKSAKDDQSVAFATRSTRRSTRDKSTEEAEEEEPTTVLRSRPSRKAKSAKDDQSVASATRSTRRSSRNKSTEEKEEEEKVVKEEPTKVRRSTPSRTAKSAKDDESVASTTRSTRRSTRNKSTEEKEEESDKEPTAARRSTSSRKGKSAKDDKSVASTTRSTRRSTRNKSAKKEEESDKEPTAARRSTPSRKGKSAKDDKSVASTTRSTRRSTRNRSKDEATGVSRSTRSLKAASTDETSVGSTMRSTRKANGSPSVSTRSSRRAKK